MWQFKQFEELSAKDYHQIAKERTKVFVVEQGSAYQEIDDIDLHAVHVIKRQKGVIKAYARVYKENKKMHLGRVLVPAEFRSEGHGRELLKVALDYIICKHPKAEIEIQAEAYLKEFYESFGFKVTSDLYYDEEIGHYDMELSKEQTTVSP
ncbi:GNAT family N-acetyltransferase [Alkalibacterium olivapovliticus]|uniref:ElaA protein n=1 Tax=Alkalibacterium olivapovliticus TaxID=99907 RepID=A0A2T0VY16_9LACT|nr:GNAT family N-acetyltransferase [Alkalibacterium olivapovliticus]PRY77141.1 ElaA protein [Alkalibacterium olivapovliticus]